MFGHKSINGQLLVYPHSDWAFQRQVVTGFTYFFNLVTMEQSVSVSGDFTTHFSRKNNCGMTVIRCETG